MDRGPMKRGAIRRGALRVLVGIALLAGGMSWGADQTASPPSVAPGNEGKKVEDKGGSPMALTLSSAAFERGWQMPKKYTGDGADVSPPLRWTDPPAASQSFALICEDSDAPMGTWVHWVLWGIAATARSLPEGIQPEKELESGVKQGTNDFRKIGYGGPAPPPGAPHRYFFRVYALDIVPNIKPGAYKKDLVRAMKDHILAEAELMCTYKR